MKKRPSTDTAHAGLCNGDVEEGNREVFSVRSHELSCTSLEEAGVHDSGCSEELKPHLPSVTCICHYTHVHSTDLSQMTDVETEPDLIEIMNPIPTLSPWKLGMALQA